MLGRAAQAYGVGSLAVPLWASLAAPLAILAMVAVTAFAITLRAGWMSTVQAIATGRAPRAARGYRAHRLLGRARHLPRPVTLGLAGPFARPTRTSACSRRSA